MNFYIMIASFTASTLAIGSDSDLMNTITTSFPSVQSTLQSNGSATIAEPSISSITPASTPSTFSSFNVVSWIDDLQSDDEGPTFILTSSSTTMNDHSMPTNSGPESESSTLFSDPCLESMGIGSSSYGQATQSQDNSDFPIQTVTSTPIVNSAVPIQISSGFPESTPVSNTPIPTPARSTNFIPTFPVFTHVPPPSTGNASRWTWSHSSSWNEASFFSVRVSGPSTTTKRLSTPTGISSTLLSTTWQVGNHSAFTIPSGFEESSTSTPVMISTASLMSNSFFTIPLRVSMPTATNTPISSSFTTSPRIPLSIKTANTTSTSNSAQTTQVSTTPKNTWFPEISPAPTGATSESSTLKLFFTVDLTESCIDDTSSSSATSTAPPTSSPSSTTNSTTTISTNSTSTSTKSIPIPLSTTLLTLNLTSGPNTIPITLPLNVSYNINLHTPYISQPLTVGPYNYDAGILSFQYVGSGTWIENGERVCGFDDGSTRNVASCAQCMEVDGRGWVVFEGGNGTAVGVGEGDGEGGLDCGAGMGRVRMKRIGCWVLLGGMNGTTVSSSLALTSMSMS